MTVCIAAQSEGMVILVADRMITAGDIEFEPAVQKMQALTSSIALMYSGEATFYAEVAQELLIDVRARIAAEPDNWLSVREVAQLWVKHWTEAKFRHAEPIVLGPYGMTRKEFVAKVGTLDAATVQKITEGLSAFKVPGIELIIAGVDMRFGFPRPSIYQIYDDAVMCADQMAFAAIGTGARHAESQFMLAKYANSVPNGEALLLAYSAKRNAEVAPGVGKETDICAIGPNLGMSNILPDALKEKVEAEYQKIVSQDEQARKAGRHAVSQFLAQQHDKTPAVQQTPTAGTSIAINKTGAEGGGS